MAKWSLKPVRQKVMVWCVPPLMLWLTRLIYLSCKRRFIIHTPYTTHMPSTIFAVWHGELLMMPFVYKEYTRNEVKLDAIISQHTDGELIARLISLLGGGTLRGSSSKGGREVYAQALRSLAKGRHLAITPDGPRGPRHSVAHGAITLAMRTKAPIVPINVHASAVWQFKSWDAFCIPKPFATLHIHVGQALHVEGVELEEAKALLRQRLLEHAQP